MQLPTILATILSLAALGAATPVAPTLESRAGSCNPEGAYGCGNVNNPQEILLCTNTGLVLVATCAPGMKCKGINGQPYCVPV